RVGLEPAVFTGAPATEGHHAMPLAYPLEHLTGVGIVAVVVVDGETAVRRAALDTLHAVFEEAATVIGKDTELHHRGRRRSCQRDTRLRKVPRRRFIHGMPV